MSIPGWVGLVLALAIAGFLGGFLAEAIADLVSHVFPRVRNAKPWQRRVLQGIVTAGAFVIVWCLAYFAFGVDLQWD